MKKMLQRIKTFFIESRYFVLGLILLFLVLTTELPYIIYAPGGLKNLDDRYTISSSYKSEGSFNLLYVTGYRANVLLYLMSLVLQNWDAVKTSDIKYDNETMDDSDKRDVIYLSLANQNAVVSAFKKANKEYTISDVHYKVIYIYEMAKTTFKVGDEILKVDNIDINKLGSLTDYINTKNVGDTLNISVKRDNIINVTAKIIEHDKKKIIGIVVPELFKVNTDPKVTFKFNPSESGSSAGLMLSLSIYDDLTISDLTHGYKIAGTGTIEDDGSVGEIGEVDKKLLSAIKGHADIFMVPNGDNYNTIMKIVKKKKYDIKVIGVSTFDEAVSALEKLK